MDDRRFDSLVKSLASGRSRRSVLKGLLGLGGAAVVGGAVLEGDSEAARRPSSTPTSVPKCPGEQTWNGGACVCPDTAPNECGPDCCTSVPGGPPIPTHSECCDSACCFGTCYDEELCCPTNNRSGGDLPIPPTNKICDTVNGQECCLFDDQCCTVDGCCDTICWGADNAFCCPAEAFCPGGSESVDICCVNSGSTLTACCNGGTNANTCIVVNVEGACCTDADCEDPCQICNPETHICGPRCDLETQICCTALPGPGVCFTGECCGDVDCGDGRLCCEADSGLVCVDDFCPNPCSAERPCNGCSTCIDGLCFDGCGEGEECCFVDPDVGQICVEEGTCTPNGCNCEEVADCCFINDVFAGCVDLTQAGACCTADTCGLEDPENCIVSGCFDFLCEPRSECLATETCCNGDCMDGDVCPTPPTCSNPESCALGQPCCDGFNCCNGSCREGTDCPPG